MHRFTQMFGITLVALALTGFGCTTMGVTKTVAVSGEALIAAGNQFVQTASVYNVQCKPTVVKGQEVFCARFKAFAPKFKEQYPFAVRAWKAAVDVQDAGAAQSAQTAILTLVSELSEIAAEAVMAGGK